MTCNTGEETPLKRRLILKHYQRKINEAIEWNFGYWDHKHPKLCEWHEEVLRLRPLVKAENPNWYEIYERTYDV